LSAKECDKLRTMSSTSIPLATHKTQMLQNVSHEERASKKDIDE